MKRNKEGKKVFGSDYWPSSVWKHLEHFNQWYWASLIWLAGRCCSKLDFWKATVFQSCLLAKSNWNWFVLFGVLQHTYLFCKTYILCLWEFLFFMPPCRRHMWLEALCFWVFRPSARLSVNALSQEHLDWKSSNLAKTLTQRGTE